MLTPRSLNVEQDSSKFPENTESATEKDPVGKFSCKNMAVIFHNVNELDADWMNQHMLFPWRFVPPRSCFFHIIKTVVLFCFYGQIDNVLGFFWLTLTQ